MNEQQINSQENLTPEEIIDDYVATYGGDYYGSLFGGYEPTPKLVISLVGKSFIKEGESTVFKVTVKDPPENRDDIEYCLGFDNNSSASYGTDYSISGPYKEYNYDNGALSIPVSDADNWDHSCNPSEYTVLKSKLPSDVDTVYYSLHGYPNSQKVSDRTANIIIYAVHTVGYAKEGSVEVTIANVLSPVSLDIRTDTANIGMVRIPANDTDDWEEQNEDIIGKPIIYHSNTSGIPLDYIWQEFLIRAKTTPANIPKRKVVLEYDSSKLEIKNGGNVISPQNGRYEFPLSNLFSNGPKPRGEEFQVRAKEAAGSVYITASIWENGNRLNGTNDRIKFDIQNNYQFNNNIGSNWVVPRGWRIGNSTLTTPMPAHTQKGIGPISEGTGVDGDYKGDVFTIGDYPNGFTLKFTYSFVKNTYQGFPDPDLNNGFSIAAPNGYMQIYQKSGDIAVRRNHRRVSFVGNSGVKIGSASGYEVQIIDIVALTNIYGGKESFKNAITVERTVPFPPFNVPEINGESISVLLPGIQYNLSPSKFDKIKIGGKANPNIEELKNIVEENYKLFGKQFVTMKIVLTANNELKVYVVEKSEESGESIDKLYFADDITTSSKKVFLQSHWGSGVTFSNISIT